MRGSPSYRKQERHGGIGRARGGGILARGVFIRHHRHGGLCRGGAERPGRRASGNDWRRNGSRRAEYRIIKRRRERISGVTAFAREILVVHGKRHGAAEAFGFDPGGGVL